MSLSYRGEHWLFTRMQKLGYKSDPKGNCFGVAHMGAQAIILGQLERFDSRIHLINEIKEDKFKSTLAEINQNISRSSHKPNKQFF